MPTGVLVMAYGTPRAKDDIEAFYTNIRRGRPPSAEELAELVSRYDAIGGTSPLLERTEAQIAALSSALDAIAPGAFDVRLGTKHGAPSLADALHAMNNDGIDEFVGIVMAPHYSALSIGEYVAGAGALAEELKMRAHFVEHWHDDPVLVELLSRRIETAIARLDEADRAAAEVVFSAHSLPARIAASGDPYVGQLEETARLVAAAAPLPRYRVCYQSAARTGEPWLGPDISEVLAECKAGAASAVVVCPAGFTSDHLEILYDLDIVAAENARALGIAFLRTESLNDDPRLAGALARRIAAAVGEDENGAH